MVVPIEILMTSKRLQHRLIIFLDHHFEVLDLISISIFIQHLYIFRQRDQREMESVNGQDVRWGAPSWCLSSPVHPDMWDPWWCEENTSPPS